MPPLEAWEKVVLQGPEAEAFLASVHGSIDCTGCHRGNDEATAKDEAHSGMVARPSEGSGSVCSNCHMETVTLASSLHGGLWGEKNLLAERYGAASFSELPEAVRNGYDQACATCHTSCGDCHVSRPRSVGGGLVAGHRFGSPDMTNQCTACHGSRVGAEYRGENEGYGADVHYVPGGMRCQSCHSAQEMHGDGVRYGHRLDVPSAPRCEGCHAEAEESNAYHESHWTDLQCQVCHSQDYKSCASCHAGSGLAEPSWMSFKIGRNPVPEKRRWSFVVLRHIPIAEDTFRAWGVPQLAEYDAQPTWKYAAPHNIRRWTDRTAVPEGSPCSVSCHRTPDGVEGYFLRQSDLDAMSPAEADANRHLIVPDGSPTNW